VKLGARPRVTVLRSADGKLAILRGQYEPDGKLLLVRKTVRIAGGR
jgi:hypothetical protein